MSTPIRRICAGCCARAASGHATVEPPIPLMKSRRRIACPEAQDRASYRLKPTLGTAPQMSAALRQKQTVCAAAARSYSITSSAAADLPVGVLERNHIATGYSHPLGGHGWPAARHVPDRVGLAESTF